MKSSLKLFRRIVAVAFLVFSFLIPNLPLLADDSLLTSFCEDNYLKLEIRDNLLYVEGILNYDNLDGAWIQFSADSSKKVKFPASSGKPFSAVAKLPNANGPFSFQLYCSVNGTDLYYSFFTNQVLIERNAQKVYTFTKSSIIENNTDLSRGWVNPKDFLLDVEKETKELADSIVGDAETDYEKIRLLYEWVAKNIYYDFDLYYSRIPERKVTAADVIKTRRGVCKGYSELYRALLNAEGIPAMIVEAYALGAGTGGNPLSSEYKNADESNHAYVEAFADGRWIILDPTWDSNNKYERGNFIETPPYGYRYFDITPELFAMNHKIISRPVADIENTPTDWARAEVLDAITAGIIESRFQGAYRDEITRGGFCRLIVNMLCQKYDVETPDELLKLKGLSAKDIFSDTDDKYILAANKLGIVDGRGNGKFDPDAGITRAEAAVMLTRASKTMRLTPNSSSPRFDDLSENIRWAENSIKTVTSLKSAEGKLVMGGTSDATFSPLGAYTVEQAILTVWRLFRCE